MTDSAFTKTASRYYTPAECPSLVMLSALTNGSIVFNVQTPTLTILSPRECMVRILLIVCPNILSRARHLLDPEATAGPSDNLGSRTSLQFLLLERHFTELLSPPVLFVCILCNTCIVSVYCHWWNLCYLPSGPKATCRIKRSARSAEQRKFSLKQGMRSFKQHMS